MNSNWLELEVLSGGAVEEHVRGFGRAIQLRRWRQNVFSHAFLLDRQLAIEVLAHAEVLNRVLHVEFGVRDWSVLQNLLVRRKHLVDSSCARHLGVVYVWKGSLEAKSRRVAACLPLECVTRRAEWTYIAARLHH